MTHIKHGTIMLEAAVVGGMPKLMSVRLAGQCISHAAHIEIMWRDVDQ